jgi:hypothetical protein
MWLRCFITAFAFGLVAPPAQAIPAFARKHNSKCYSCHTLPPVLNKTGYLFKRLGYRLPPDEMEGGANVLRTIDLEKTARWNIGNTLALVGQVSYTAKQLRGDERESSSSINFDKALVLVGGVVPQTNFFYFGEVKFTPDETEFEMAYAGYCGGKANSSYFVKAGKMPVQEGEGTRALAMYSLFPDVSPILKRSGPAHFTLDNNPAGVGGGYTWASSYFKNVVGVSAKVTNGVNEAGEPRGAEPNRNSKDVWGNVDWWFGPDGGISVMAYYGRKDQTQLAGSDGEFVFRPHIRRYGIFGNYLFFNKLDVQGGYLRGQDDWKLLAAAPLGRLSTDAYRTEVDFYAVRGLVFMGRYERFHLKGENAFRDRAESWAAGAAIALTPVGNVVLRGTYGVDHNPSLGNPDYLSSRRFMLDLRLMW